MPMGRIKAPRCNCRDAVIIVADPRFDLRGILQADHGRDKRVGQSCRTTAKAAGACIENGRPRRDNFRACHCLSRVALLCKHGFGKSSGFLMIHQTFETTLRETDPRMESADDDLF
jgi:hypothetical protein